MNSFFQCRSYFMFHGMDINKPQSVFQYLPVLSFTESYIYQVMIYTNDIKFSSLFFAKGENAAPRTVIELVGRPWETISM